MDIYIGGVPNRAAALHGDVVAIMLTTPDQWKVLYDLLDVYLDENEAEKHVVYSSLDSNIATIDTYNASSCNPTYNTNQDISTTIRSELMINDVATHCKCGQSINECDCDVIVEESSESNIYFNADDTDGRKKRRRKKGQKNKNADQSNKVQDGTGEYQQTDQLFLLPSARKIFSQTPTVTNAQEEASGWGELPELSSGDPIDPGFVVSLEDLSECEMSDNESVNSEILDVDQFREDRDFFSPRSKKDRNRPNKGSAEKVSGNISINFIDNNISKCDETDLKVKDINQGCDAYSGILVNDFACSVNNLKCKSENSETNYVKNNLKDSKVDTNLLMEDVNQKVVSLSLHNKSNNSNGSKKTKRSKVCDQIVNSISNLDNDLKASKDSDILLKDIKNKSPKINNCQAEKISYSNKKTNIPKQFKQTSNLSPKAPNSGMKSNNQDGTRSEPTIPQIQRIKNWSKFIQRTAYVVYIVERKHTCIGAGTLKLFGDKNTNFALFSPNDNRVPRMKIPMSQCPADFFMRSRDYMSRIFMARIVKWTDPKFALGELVKDLGAVGDIEAETQAMLLEYGIDESEFPAPTLEGLPTQLPWRIPQEEIKRRTDLRNSCIFTIDPATARDLDDAMSCLPMSSGNYRVGVHIADVTYFIKEATPLDQFAADRATSVYLTQKVIPMLPRLLCESLCSLNPDEDRLTFSVIWELTPDGKIVGEWFGKTVIRSCVKLSYEHAQSMIDAPGKQWEDGEIPAVSGGYTVKQISDSVNNLNKIAMQLRKKRFQDGALRLDQLKLSFNLDSDTKMPNGFYVYEYKDSNKLIEEFMLLANMAVANKIYQVFPMKAILRRHPPPLDGPMDTVKQLLSSLGVKLDPSTAGSLNVSIHSYIGDDKYSQARMQLIVSMCSKPMQFARYFCTGHLVQEPLFQHYALNVPFYTHFTSPIRRYADVMVHRLLAAAIQSELYSCPSMSTATAQQKSDHCNDKKQTAKTVSDLSNEMYLGLFVKQIGELVEEGMVMGVLDKAFDVLLLKLGVVKRVYTDKIPVSVIYSKIQGKPSLNLTWKADASKSLPEISQTITYFTIVTVSLRPFENGALKFNAILLRPKN